MSRAKQLNALLDGPREALTLPLLAHYAKAGVPDGDALRPRCWRYLTGLVNLKDEARAEQQLARSRAAYASLVQDVMDSCAAATSNGDTMQALDQALLASAHDVQRTASGLSFFSTAIRSPNPLNDVSSSRNMFERLYSLRTYRQSQTSRRSNRYSTGSAASTSSKTSADASEELYWESLHRILFVYAALSPLGYVQGMNEVAAVLLFVFAHDPTDEGRFAEADAFNSLSLLLGNGLSDLYSAHQDGNFDLASSRIEPGTGLSSTLAHFWRRLQLLDLELFLHLQSVDIEPSYFLVKWITTLFAQTFVYAELFSVWDFVLAGMNAASAPETPFLPLIETSIDVALAMVVSVRDLLLGSDFARCLGVLQNFDCQDLSKLLAESISIQARRLAGDFLVPQTPPKKLSLKERLQAATDAASPKIKQDAAVANAQLSKSINSSYQAFVESDAAASLSRFGSNLNASVVNWRTAAPDTMAKLSETMHAIGDSVKESAQAVVKRPSSPTTDQPFIPPSDSPTLGHKPLLLSSSASVIGDRSASPTSSRRSSIANTTPTMKSSGSLSPQALGSPIRSPGFSSIRYMTHNKASSSSFSPHYTTLEDVPLSRRRQGSEPLSSSRYPLTNDSPLAQNMQDFGVLPSTPTRSAEDESLEVLASPERHARTSSLEGLAASFPASMQLESPPPRRQSLGRRIDAMTNGTAHASGQGSSPTSGLSRTKLSSNRRRQQGSRSSMHSISSVESKRSDGDPTSLDSSLDDYVDLVNAYG